MFLEMQLLEKKYPKMIVGVYGLIRKTKSGNIKMRSLLSTPVFHIILTECSVKFPGLRLRLTVLPESVVWNYYTSDKTYVIQNDLTKYLNECYC